MSAAPIVATIRDVLAKRSQGLDGEEQAAAEVKKKKKVSRV